MASFDALTGLSRLTTVIDQSGAILVPGAPHDQQQLGVVDCLLGATNGLLIANLVTH